MPDMRMERLFDALHNARPRPHEHHRGGGSSLREVVFGANDGLVSNVALVAGLAGSTTDAKVILMGGIAGVMAGAISMALGSYISSKSEREFRETEENRERWEVEHLREQEVAETRDIFRLKGITGNLLDQVVVAVSRDHDRWVRLMMTDELGFAEEPPQPTLNAIVMGMAFAIAALFPVVPYVFLGGASAFAASLAATGIALFLVAGWRAYLTGGAIMRKSLEMLVLATAAVAVANGVGHLVGVRLS